MLKLFDNDSFDYGQDVQLAQLMPVASRGVDRDWLKKRAAVLSEEIANVKPEPGHTAIHIVAMVAGETGGANKNADYYSRGDLMAKHHTFVSNALVYKNHISHDPALSSGKVLASAFNEPMDRVELVISVCNDKWRPELDSLARGNDLKFSMSCKLPFDVCRICGNKARKRTEYCQCMRTMPGKWLDNGKQVCVDNPNPNFYDISGVGRPADVVAFILQKVASAGVITGAELYETVRAGWGLKPSRKLFQKLSAIAKLSELEKTIEATAPGDVTGLADTAESSGLSDEQTDKLRGFAEHRLPELLSALHQYKIVLPLPDFIKIVLQMRQAPEANISVHLPGVFSSEADDDMAQDSKYDPEYFPTSSLPGDIRQIVQQMAGPLSLDDEQINDRKLHAVVIRKEARLRAPLDFTVKSSARVERVPALEYASYLLSTVHDLGDRAMKVAVVRNYGC